MEDTYNYVHMSGCGTSLKTLIKQIQSYFCCKLSNFAEFYVRSCCTVFGIEV